MSRNELQQHRRALNTPAARYMRGEISATEYARVGRDDKVDYLSGALAIVRMQADADAKDKGSSPSTS